MPRDDIRGPKWDINTGIPDLSGKVAIVTGANAFVGIGWHVAFHLARNGAKVYVGARSATKADAAISEMRNKSPDKTLNLQPLAMDLADFKQVKACATTFVKEESRLDILVNNAGLLARPLDKDANGISVSFATNHLAPFLFTTELLPLIKKTAAINPGVRVVNLSSTTHALLKPGVTFSSISDFNVELGGTDDFNSNLQRYGLSKLANILVTKELQRRFDKENVNAIAITLHPGGVKTEGSINFVGGPAHISRLDAAESMLAVDGALTPLFAATNPAVWTEKEKYKGQYLLPFGVIEPTSENANNAELARQLWETSEAVVQVLSK